MAVAGTAAMSLMSMKREEAKHILSVYRASGEDASDPLFRDALNLASQDPELARWFAEDQAWDLQISKKLGDLPAPRHLRDRLLASRKIIRPASWWLRPIALAAAAAVVLTTGTTFWLVKRSGSPSDFADFSRVMVKASLDMSQHIDVMGLSAAELHTWIADRGGTADFVLPPGMAGHSAVGCKILDWRGHKVTLLCFKPTDGKHFDIFVVQEMNLQKDVSSAAPQFGSIDGQTTAAWCREGKIYFLAGSVPKSDFQKLLQAI